MTPFRLAHLSDLHLPPLAMARMRELAGKRATGLYNWRRTRRHFHREEIARQIVEDIKAQQPDHIAVTGDLINIALEIEFIHARRWLETVGPPSQVSLVPGNHDAYVRSAAAFPRLHWQDYMAGDGAAAGNAEFPYVRRLGAIAIVGVSSAIPTAPLIARGRVGPEQLQRLGNVLTELGREGLFRVVLIHHPPVSKAANSINKLNDASALRAVLAHSGAELLLHGHNHIHEHVWLKGSQADIPSFGVPSASGIADGKHDMAGYNLYEISRHGNGWHCQVISRGLDSDATRVVELKRLTVHGSNADATATAAPR
jgi:3',5'-cyclic AMP phosphodiesterase CpdA